MWGGTCLALTVEAVTGEMSAPVLACDSSVTSERGLIDVINCTLGLTASSDTPVLVTVATSDAGEARVVGLTEEGHLFRAGAPVTERAAVAVVRARRWNGWL